MRRLVKIAVAASVLGTAFFGPAEAAFIGMPMNLGVQLSMAGSKRRLWPRWPIRMTARPAKSFSGAVMSGSLHNVSRT